MNVKLPHVKDKKKIDPDKFLKRAKELKKYFQEEKAYLRKKELEDESLLSGRFL